uniref:Uncharacterized protein n=1 Tax=Minutocellus polymorphus TaxID=265543 RepID=A0A7S0FTF1_9STRA|mmetsp:Transcript_8693/g.14320  ORF Transcript_8693/g.14320 Transcript_8693/m.14320 type:complete len:136 (+) Transcript_8693:87-494(+)|eukprot:CAMPEP_0197733950 /NCGR_PEP_ID=MMETSP1434-20131217/44170_1 /TAXON_ID=265543 /ORGANISM="Minutocellus polymorphus, Strain CCMP3303" /LENGTH=135 /DNA_ID=CAMNT_0043321349 /DNA_START=87 /DNA_END=494 /DNA_ORIENTATION=+
MAEDLAEGIARAAEMLQAKDVKEVIVDAVLRAKRSGETRTFVETAPIGGETKYQFTWAGIPGKKLMFYRLEDALMYAHSKGLVRVRDDELVRLFSSHRNSVVSLFAYKDASQRKAVEWELKRGFVEGQFRTEAAN